MQLWNTFAEKHPAAAKWVREGGLFVIVSNLITVFKYLLLQFLPKAFAGLPVVDFGWPGIPVTLFGETSQWNILGYDAAHGGLPYFCAYMIAMVIGECINFPIQRNFVFRSKGNLGKQIAWHVLAFCIVNSINCVCGGGRVSGAGLHLQHRYDRPQRRYLDGHLLLRKQKHLPGRGGSEGITQAGQRPQWWLPGFCYAILYIKIIFRNHGGRFLVVVVKVDFFTAFRASVVCVRVELGKWHNRLTAFWTAQVFYIAVRVVDVIHVQLSVSTENRDIVGGVSRVRGNGAGKFHTRKRFGKTKSQFLHNTGNILWCEETSLGLNGTVMASKCCFQFGRRPGEVAFVKGFGVGVQQCCQRVGSLLCQRWGWQMQS